MNNVLYPNFGPKGRKTNRKVKAGIQTELLDDLITDHSHKIGALRSNERFKTTSIDVFGSISNIEGEIQAQEVH